MGRGTSKMGSSGGGGNARGAKNAPIDLTTATAAQISAMIDATDDVDKLSDLIETIADNNVISNDEYTSLYQKALTKVQIQQPDKITLPSDWKEYASEEIDTFMAGMSMDFPTPKGKLTVTINGLGAGFTTKSLYDGSVINSDTGKVLYRGNNLPMKKLRKALKKAVIE